MKKKRHIEITAVRRRMTVFTGNMPGAASHGQSPQDNDEDFCSAVAHLLTTKQANFIHGQLQSARSPEVRELIEALTESRNDTATTTKQLGLGRKEIMGLVAAKHNCYGELAESKPLLDGIVRAARSINHKPSLLGGLVWRGQMHFFQTDYQRAEEVMIETKALAAELRDGFQLLHSLFFLGLIRGNMGLMSQAFADLNEAIEMARRNGDHFWASRLPNCIGWIHRELQDFNTR